jgi:excinuclease ABC subunit A
MPEKQYIRIKGAREHNLKNVHVDFPLNKMIAVTGVSGSGKSSLAFDTLFAEGQRRYIESLSSYARQFLGKISKPDVDDIEGLPPAIAIEQRTISKNPRSTVGTVTEIYEYLKLLYSRIGKTYSPKSGTVVQKHTVADVRKYITGFPPETRIVISCPATGEMSRDFADELIRQGYSRLDIEGEIVTINDYDYKKKPPVLLVTDRLTSDGGDENRSRIEESVEKAFSCGNGVCMVRVYDQNGLKESRRFSDRFEADGMIFQEPTAHMFAFNSPAGACPRCEGYGSTIGIDTDLVIPDKTLSVYQDAVVCWRGEVMQEWKMKLITHASRFSFPLHTPYNQLSEDEKNVLWNGNRYFGGISDFFKMLEENLYKIQYRVMLSRYRGKTVCPDCRGTRLRKEATWVKVGGKSVADLVQLPVKDLLTFFNEINLDKHDRQIASRLVTEILSRIQYLADVGLGYLTLNRAANSLSGGETQRIMLASQLGSGLVGSLYILDEPSIGLHARDTHRLIKVLENLRDAGNTVVVVEHDEEIIRASDYIIDIGPEAGSRGGEVIFSGKTADLKGRDNSITARYLFEKGRFTFLHDTRKWSHTIKVNGARQHNLKNINVTFPLNNLVVVSGVSGSGKSTLVKTILYPALSRHFGNAAGNKPGEHDGLSGDLHRLTGVDMVDQNPIGRSSRSNPVTYIKAYDDIRALFAQQVTAKQYGFKPSSFSFNVEGGRCEECQGEGFLKIEMQFLADVNLVCDSCNGKRFKDEVLEVLYRGKSIHDILEMTIGDATAFFSEGKSLLEQKITEKLRILEQVGLDYLKMGQSSAFLSGGESQRLKLATYISHESTSPMLFIFDEPTTGLHAHDIRKLMSSFNALLDRGHSIIVVEHNPDIIIQADWLIELGPEGGEEGGFIVYEGLPAGITDVQNSPTGAYFLK